MNQHDASTPGMVYLVAIAPGDPGLITLRGVECLRQADLVLHDSSVKPVVLGFAPPSAEVVCLGERAEGPSGLQEIGVRVRESARRGKAVVWLSSGGAGAHGEFLQQAEVLRGAGVGYEKVPEGMADPASQGAWFRAKPLFGLRVLVTRPRRQAEILCDQLGMFGAEVSVQPVIEISDPPDWASVDRALAELDRYDWLVFSSVNGVAYLLDRLFRSKGDLRALGSIRLAAIGPGTAEELARHHLKADLVPSEYRAESLAAALAGEASGRQFLLARASRGREVLAERLRAAGGLVEQIVVYSSSDVEHADPQVAADLAAGRIDWITVTSSAIARSLGRLFGNDLHRSKLASISPVTSQVLRELGYEPAAEATEYTMTGLVEAIKG